MSKGKDIVQFRKRIKIALVKAFGGKCQVCETEYPEYIFDFHHLDPSTKEFGIGNASTTRARSAYAAEAKKCIMVCSNCHRHIEMGAIDPSKLCCVFNEELYYQTINEQVGRNQIIEEVKPIRSMKPEREQLKKDIRSMSMVDVGRKYLVSDNAVRKWCKTYSLPSKVSEIKAYSDEEWERI